MSENLSWKEIKNWWPLLVAAITITVSLTGVYYRLGAIEKKVETLVMEISEWKNDSVEPRLGDARSRIVILERDDDRILRHLGLD